MIPHKQPKKKDDDHDGQQNPKKNGKSVIPGGTVRMGRGQPELDSGNPDLDIDSAMLMKAKPLKFQKSAPSSKEQEAL